MSTTDRATNQELTLTKDGNRYYISIYNPETNQAGFKGFTSRLDAIEVYQDFMMVFAMGKFDFQYRVMLLENS